MHKYKLTTLKHEQKGLSLIELIIALGLGVIVLSGVGSAMVQMSLSTAAQTEKNKMEQTANIAFSFIEERARAALASPCEKFSVHHEKSSMKIDPLATTGGISAAAALAIQEMLEGGGMRTESASINVGGVATTTDTIAFISTLPPLNIKGETGIKGNDLKIEVDEPYYPLSMAKHKLFAVSNCVDMDVFGAKSITTAAGLSTIVPADNSEFRINYREAESGMVSPLVVNEIYVRGQATGTQTGGRLFEKELYDVHSNETSLLSGVDAMRVVFGVDSQGQDGSIDRYVTASEVDKDDLLVTMDIHLLISADGQRSNSILPNSYTVTLPNTTVPIGADGKIVEESLVFTDKILRRVFTRSITLRNNAGI